MIFYPVSIGIEAVLFSPDPDRCLASAMKLEEIQGCIGDIVNGKRIVGHQLWRDFYGERAGQSATLSLH